jgi:hypothetical protein
MGSSLIDAPPEELPDGGVPRSGGQRSKPLELVGDERLDVLAPDPHDGRGHPRGRQEVMQPGDPLVYAWMVRALSFSARRCRRNDGRRAINVGSVAATLWLVTGRVSPSRLVGRCTAVPLRRRAYPQVTHWPVG